MNIFENENSLNKNTYNISQINSKNISLINLKFIHKIINSINISLIILISILSFLSFNSQREWTNLYSLMKDIRIINNSLFDYISIIEEQYINEIDKLDNFKKTTSKDLIYITNKSEQQKINKINKFFFNLRKGIQEGRYQRGNL